MKNKRQKIEVFILFLAIIILFFIIKNQKANKKVIVLEKEQIIETSSLKIGLITDVHCYTKFNKDTKEWNLNWRCEKPMNAFVEKMNNDFQPDFVIENGDLVDGRDNRSYETFIEAKSLYEKNIAPNYHVLGNHETRGFIKKTWLELVGYEKPYYYFDKNGFRIIILDGNNKPLVDGADFYNTTPERDYYPGLIDPEQMEWLKNLLKESKLYKKVIFVHQPLFPTDRRNQDELFIDGKNLRKLFSENNVLAVFSGHTERFCHLKEDGVNYYVLQGFWKANRGLKKEYQFKDQGFFYEILIDNEDIEIFVNYNPEEEDDNEDEGYLRINFSELNNNCLDSGQLLIEDDELED